MNPCYVIKILLMWIVGLHIAIPLVGFLIVWGILRYDQPMTWCQFKPFRNSCIDGIFVKTVPCLVPVPQEIVLEKFQLGVKTLPPHILEQLIELKMLHEYQLNMITSHWKDMELRLNYLNNRKAVLSGEILLTRILNWIASFEQEQTLELWSEQLKIFDDFLSRQQLQTIDMDKFAKFKVEHEFIVSLGKNKTASDFLRESGVIKLFRAFEFVKTVDPCILQTDCSSKLYPFIITSTTRLEQIFGNQQNFDKVFPHFVNWVLSRNRVELHSELRLINELLYYVLELLASDEF